MSTNVQKHPIDNNLRHVIMTVEEIAQFFQKSPSWVYKNWKILGGRKLGGSLFFPTKEDLYERLFSQKEGVEVRLHSQGTQVHECLVQNKKKCIASRSKAKGGNKESKTESGGTDRHGLFRVG